MTLVSFFSLLTSSAIIATGCLALLASWFDLRQLRLRPQLTRRLRQLTKAKQPTVTVIIYCFNHEKFIASTLVSLRRSSYKSLQIVVIDNASYDHTARVVRRFLRRHPDQRFTLYTKRRHTDEATALKLAYTKVAYSPYILTLTAGDSVPSSLIKNAVAHIQLLPAVRVLILRRLASDWQRIDQIMPRLVAAAQHLLLRAFYPTSWSRQATITPARLYYHEAFLAPPHSRHHTYCHTDQPLTHVRAHQRIVKPVTIAMGILLLVGLSIPLYLAASLQASAPLIITWLLLSGWAILATVSDKMPGSSERFLLLAAAPVVYALLYAWLLVTGLLLLGRLFMVAIQRRRIGGQTKRSRNQHDVFDNVLPLKIWHKPTNPSMFRHQYERRTYHGKMDQK